MGSLSWSFHILPSFLCVLPCQIFWQEITTVCWSSRNVWDFLVIGRALPLGCLSCHTSLVFLGIRGLSFWFVDWEKSHNNIVVSGGRYSGNKGLPRPFLLTAGLWAVSRFPATDQRYLSPTKDLVTDCDLHWKNPQVQLKSGESLVGFIRLWPPAHTWAARSRVWSGWNESPHLTCSAGERSESASLWLWSRFLPKLW